MCIGRSGPNLEHETMRVYLTNGPRNGLNIGRKVGPYPGSRRRWVLDSAYAFSQAVYATNPYRLRFQVRTRLSYILTPVESAGKPPAAAVVAARAYIYTHTYIYIYVDIYIYIHICICTRIYIYINSCLSL